MNISDQAAALRRLVSQSSSAHQKRSASHRTICVIGGKGGVGTTTVALNLATSLSRLSHRTALFDADISGGDLHRMCEIDSGPGLQSVMESGAKLADVMVSGPDHILFVPSTGTTNRTSPISDREIDRLVDEMETFEAQIDFLLLDAGSGNSLLGRRICDIADELLLVTTPDDLAIMDTYTTLKTSGIARDGTPLHLLVNQAPDLSSGTQAAARFSRACRRFLGIELAGRFCMMKHSDFSMRVAKEDPTVGNDSTTLPQAAHNASDAMLPVAHHLITRCLTSENGLLDSPLVACE